MEGMPARFKDAFPRPSVMGVVNVTPDSFSDGGSFFEPEPGSRAGLYGSPTRVPPSLTSEASRPGRARRESRSRRSCDESFPCSNAWESVPISIDTSKAEVARRAVELGAVMVNDVSALRADVRMAEVVADTGVFLCLMHMLGEPRTMQLDPRYGDVVSEVSGFLEERLTAAVEAGVTKERICVDPGIGFGKTVDQNLELLARLDEIARLGRPVMVGASRKRFLGCLLGDPQALEGSASASVATQRSRI